MKKAGRIICGVVLGTAFLVAAGVFCWQYIGRDGEEQETSKKNIIEPKERKIYEFGDEIECGDLTWNISGAELVTDYDSLDSYYKNRENLSSPLEEIKDRRLDIFEEEMLYLRIEGTVTNTSNYSQNCDFDKMAIFNRMEDESFEQAIYTSDRRQDCRYINEDSSEGYVEYISDTYAIPKGKTVKFEYVVQFSEYDMYKDFLYDLYLSTAALYPSRQKGNVVWEEKVHLNIAPKHLHRDKTEPENTLEEQRDITDKKRRQWVNTDIREYQKEGYPILPPLEPGEEVDNSDPYYRREEGVTEESIPFSFGDVTSRIKSAQVTDWNALPEEFTSRQALQDMAECYNAKGYEKEQLKILLLDIAFVSEEGNSENHFNFFDHSYLFTRDEAGKRWVFGTADDWIVTENSLPGGRTGHINGEWFGNNQSVTVRMAYLLPPQIYNEGALYFSGGTQDRNYCNETIQKIPLL